MSPETPLPQGLREGTGRAWDRQQGTEQTGMYESKAFGNTSTGHDPQPLTRSPHAAARLPHTPGGDGGPECRRPRGEDWRSVPPCTKTATRMYNTIKHSPHSPLPLIRAIIIPLLHMSLISRFTVFLLLFSSSFISLSSTMSTILHTCSKGFYFILFLLFLLVVIVVVGSMAMEGASELQDSNHCNTIL